MIRNPLQYYRMNSCMKWQLTSIFEDIVLAGQSCSNDSRKYLVYIFGATDISGLWPLRSEINLLFIKTSLSCCLVASRSYSPQNGVAMGLPVKTWSTLNFRNWVISCWNILWLMKSLVKQLYNMINMAAYSILYTFRLVFRN